MHKIRAISCPSYLRNLLIDYNSHPGLSDHHQKTNCLRLKSSKAAAPFGISAPRIWNSLPDDIQDTPALDAFKKRLKTHLFKQALNWWNTRPRISPYITKVDKLDIKTTNTTTAI